MGVILRIEDAWTQQPSGPVVVKQEFAPRYCWLPEWSVDVVAQLPITYHVNPYKPVGTPFGLAHDCGTDTARILISGATQPVGQFIVLAVFQNTVTNTNSIIVAGKTYWNTANGFMFETKTNSDTLEINGGDAATFPTLSVAGVGTADGKLKTIAVKFSGTSASVAMNGRSYGTVTIGQAGTFPSGIGIGNYAGSSYSVPPNRRFFMAAILQFGDIVGLSADPWQIFAP